MESEKISRINAFLARHGASIDTISKQKLAQFEKVDDAIQARLADINKARDILQGKPINVSAIAADTGISRKTFYNNDTLRLFVEEYSACSGDKTGAEGDAERLRARCEELEAQVRMFLLRDVATENRRHENMRLQTEIQNLQARNTTLEEQYERLQDDYAELKCKFPNGGHVLKFKQPN